MGVILGKVVLKCPKTGKKVVMHNDCMNADGKGNNCEHFLHYSIQGSKIAVTCKLAESKTKWQTNLEGLTKRQNEWTLKRAKKDGIITD